MRPPDSAPARGQGGPGQMPEAVTTDDAIVGDAPPDREPHGPRELSLVAEPLAVDDRGAAALVGVSRAHWRRLAAAGRVPAPFRLGRRTLWSVERLRAWDRDGGGRP